MIVSEDAISKGIRRIIAVSGSEAAKVRLSLLKFLFAIIGAGSSENGTYHICKQQRLRRAGISGAFAVCSHNIGN